MVLIRTESDAGPFFRERAVKRLYRLYLEIARADSGVSHYFVLFRTESDAGPLGVEQAVKRIWRSRVGNPHRLAAMFRRYDPSRTQRVSLQEFTQVMLDCDLDLSRSEAMQLAQVRFAVLTVLISGINANHS